MMSGAQVASELARLLRALDGLRRAAEIWQAGSGLLSVQSTGDPKRDFESMREAVNRIIEKLNEAARVNLPSVPENMDSLPTFVDDMEPVLEDMNRRIQGAELVSLQSEPMPKAILKELEQFDAEILTNEGGGEYTFQEVLLEAAGGTWDTFDAARTNDAADPAYEKNLNASVPVGTIVRMEDKRRLGGAAAWGFQL